MLIGHRLWTRWSTTFVILIAMSVCPAVRAFAQSENKPSLLSDVAKRVALDPTTYAPALLGYDATVRDWNSSQPFFRYGFVEHNARFTVSGRPDDVAMGYQAGRQKILGDAWGNLQMSLVNNAASAIFEHVLIEKYPDHPKLVRTLGWVERIGFASFMSYQLSAEHYRQWHMNDQKAQQLGLR
jgi:hypothetical protein